MTEGSSDMLARLVHRQSDLESLFTMMQRTMDELDDVVIQQGKRIDLLERKLAALTAQVGTLEEPESRRLEDDKPPHY